MKRAIPLLLCAWLAGGVAAAEPATRGYSVYFDQDLFVPGTNQDRDYTMGLGIEVFEEQGPLYLLGDILDTVGPVLRFDRQKGRIHQSWFFGSVTYTPDDIANPEPIRDDRPYASLLYLANKKVVTDDDQALGIEIMVGAIGLDVAEQVQSGLHGWVRDTFDTDEPQDPEGWRHQISDGGELTVRLRVARSHLWRRGDAWDLAGGWEANLGFQTNASIGLTARYGDVDSPFWSVPYDPINRGAFVPSLRDDELYVWAAGRLRAVAYDALLQGQFRDSEVTVSGDDMRRLVWEGGVGVTKAWPGLQVTFAINAKAGDTELPRAPEQHVWGGLYFSWGFR
ncbi:MAG: lipid A deacylase LpxR family protein [Gammaproteobacteria bacterium]|nr:lipid A deacylase LpxR family protein [Gammaproteobacteria bacterium]